MKIAPPTRAADPEAIPTREDIANGWTSAALAEHVRQVNASERIALEKRLFPDRPPLQAQTVASFNPHEW